MTEHATLAPQRWARFTLGQQILQIGVEMHRATSALRPDRLASLRAGYERALQLVDLTVEVNANASLRRELLLWRGVVAELALRDEPDPELHRQALKVLLELHPESAGQVAILGL